MEIDLEELFKLWDNRIEINYDSGEDIGAMENDGDLEENPFEEAFENFVKIDVEKVCDKQNGGSSDTNCFIGYREFKLTNNEAAILYMYLIATKIHKEINNGLRTESDLEYVNLFKLYLNNVLDKFPSYDCETICRYNNYWGNDEELLTKFEKIVSQTYCFREFNSCHYDCDKKVSSGVYYIFETKVNSRAKNLNKFHPNLTEKEILIMADTSFRVTKVDKDKKEVYFQEV
ncbi:MAG: hypothetical protein HYZ42_08295 [Bacteroidetes bacterium]|nr:hypothetical protein [Bacteroidota bacterium]